jgi:CheY-like chemotaxis protein
LNESAAFQLADSNGDKYMIRILIIDDSRLARRMVRLMLEGGGYEVVEAGDGEEGLALAAQKRFDCILLDLFLPGLSGLEVLKAIRKSDLKTPVVVVTSEEQNALLDECRQLGATQVINKLRSHDELFNALGIALGKSEKAMS